MENLFGSDRSSGLLIEHMGLGAHEMHDYYCYGTWIEIRRLGAIGRQWISVVASRAAVTNSAETRSFVDRM